MSGIETYSDKCSHRIYNLEKIHKKDLDAFKNKYKQLKRTLLPIISDINI